MISINFLHNLWIESQSRGWWSNILPVLLTYLCHVGYCCCTPGLQFSHLLCFVFNQPSYGRLILLFYQRVSKGTYKIKRQQRLDCNFFIKLVDKKAGDIFQKQREKDKFEDGIQLWELHEEKFGGRIILKY